jgi:hypothetical protein
VSSLWDNARSRKTSDPGNKISNYRLRIHDSKYVGSAPCDRKSNLADIELRIAAIRLMRVNAVAPRWKTAPDAIGELDLAVLQRRPTPANAIAGFQ